MKTLFFTLIMICGGILSAQDFYSEDITIDETIEGSLYSPKPEPSVKRLAIVIAGSGPTDRNGNQPGMENNSLRFLAEELAKSGIYVFNFDKRFLKEMTNPDFKEEDLIFDDMIADVREIINYFKNRGTYKAIDLIGHSEGSLVGILAAQKEDVARFISIAGPGRSADVIIKEQIERQAPFLVEETENILKELKKGNKVEEINPFLVSLFRESVQPYLISWFKYDPSVEIEQLKIPVLIIQGEKDLQVPVEDARLLHKASSGSELLILPEMNHVLKNIEGGTEENQKAYTQPDLPVNQKLIQKISEFLKE